MERQTLQHILAALVLCSLAGASSADNYIRFMGIAVSDALPTTDPQAAFTQMYNVGPLQSVIDLLKLTPDEVSTLQSDFVAFLKNELSIDVDPKVQAGLNATQAVSITPRVSKADGSASDFLASPLGNGGVPDAIFTPFVRSTVHLPSTIYPFTGNATVDGDTFDLKEAGYLVYPLHDLVLNSTVGTIPTNTFLNSCILTWVGKSTGLAYRIKSTRRIPIPPGQGILFNAYGYPSSKFLDLPKGEVQAAYTFVPAPGNPSALVGRWTTTHSHPTF